MRFVFNTNKFILKLIHKISFLQTIRKRQHFMKHYKSLSELKFSSFIITNKESMNNSNMNPSADSRCGPNNSRPQSCGNGPNSQFNGYYQFNPSTSRPNTDYTIDEQTSHYGFSSFNSYTNSHHMYRPYDSSTNYSQNRRHFSEVYPTSAQISEMIGRFRKWNITSRDKNNKNSIEFSIMTYNILSQDLLEVHSSLYRHCDQSSISWPERGSRIIRELRESNADIICLQEVHSQHFKDIIMPALKPKGYSAIFKQKTGAKLDGCAVLYNENRFLALKSIKLELMRTDLSSILDRDNIALIVELKPKELVDSDTKLIVANTHLLYNPKRGDVKMAQIRLLLAEIDKIALKSKTDDTFHYHPIILCGDMNTEPNSLLYNFIRNGSANFEGSKLGDISGQKEGFGRGRDVDDNHLKLYGVTPDSRYESISNIEDQNKSEDTEKMFLKHNFKFRSVYPFTDSSRKKLVSTSNCYESGLVDYIFYETHSKKLRLLGFQQLLNYEQVKQIGNIPNAHLGSDHLSLKAKFLIK